jgi:predicted dehydrogenase
MKEVRLGVIGVGAMGSTHTRYTLEGKVRSCRLAAICDSDPKALAAFPGVKHFSESEKLIRSGEVDAVIVATPHYGHTSIGIDALNNGLHLLVEKPLSVHVNDCKRLIAAHKDKSKIFAIMFMYRSETPWMKLRQIIQSGELGRIQRMHWTTTEWFRPDSYFGSAPWRGSWKGEGGGILTNQCPHDLDLWQWLFGMPKSIRAFCGFGKYHKIEVEDEVTAFMEYEDGRTGTFIAGTAEAPGTNRMEIMAERGKLVLESRKIRWIRNELSATEFMRKSPDFYEAPPAWEMDISVPFSGGSHQEIAQNFVDAILQGKPLVAPAEEGIRAVELANAMLYSSMTGQTLNLPLDADAYEKKLKELIAASGK